MRQHPTIEISVPHSSELRRVDIKIVPVVQWLNRLGANTLFSCQGDKKQHPYVVFLCDDQDSLKNILHGLWLILERGNSFEYAKVEVTIHFLMEYRLEFASTQHLALFVRDIGTLSTSEFPYQNISTLNDVATFMKWDDLL